jgi:peptide methionine sulfoxide reductase msrA/msrB
MKEIYFAGGCFWGTQHFLKQIRGVVATAAGYANGEVVNPTYEQVYTDATGYAETVKVLYDPAKISLPVLVELYFRSIDPTLLNRQGGDVGTRYRTGIYYTSPDERPVIRAVYDRIASGYSAPLVVELMPLRNFYAAEEYHQDYLDKNPGGYCHIPYSLIEFARSANSGE